MDRDVSLDWTHEEHDELRDAEHWRDVWKQEYDKVMRDLADRESRLEEARAALAAAQEEAEARVRSTVRTWMASYEACAPELAATEREAQLRAAAQALDIDEIISLLEAHLECQIGCAAASQVHPQVEQLEAFRAALATGRDAGEANHAE